MKTKEELNVLKEEVKTLNRKLAELTEEELAEVTGGIDPKSNLYFISQELDIFCNGKNGKPTLPLWD